MNSSNSQDPGQDQAAVMALLADPRTHGGLPVRRIDTHGSVVFLAGERAYKLKRAVRFPYMDYSTVERRRRCCEAELRLNRRTAPDLYLGVEPVVRRDDGGLALGGAGAVLDWVVVMRRMDDTLQFDRLAERGALTPALMVALADTVAAFHDDAEPRTEEGGAAAMRWVVEGNLDELAGQPQVFAPDRVARLRACSLTHLERLAPLMERRRQAGFVRVCHGDLHLRNICLLDGRPTPFDAIEFNDALAVIDVLYDLAFLLMDLDARGLRQLANVAFNRYIEVTADLDGLALLPLFLATRAAVRAKVNASAAAAQTDAAAAARLQAEAVGYLERALAYLEPPPARMVAAGGLSGSGKTSLARALAPAVGPAPGAVVLRSDVLRKRLLGVDEDTRLGRSGYSETVTARVYAELARRARAALAAGHAVIVDAVFARPAQRQAIEQVAAEAGVPFHGFWLQADPQVLIERVTGRTGDASDATADVVRLQLGYDLGPLTWHRIDAGNDTARLRDEVLGLLR